MVTIATLASAVGALAGLLAVGLWSAGLAPLDSSWMALTLSAGVLLIVDSLAAFVGPKRIFYGSGVLSVLLAWLEWVGSGSDATVATWVTIGAAGAALVLSLMAARSEPNVSEQSNPMNLPVFG